MIEQLPRVVAAAFALHGLGLVLLRWQVTRVLTLERRFLLLFMVIQQANVVLSAGLKIHAGRPVDASSWLSALTQSFLTAYLYYAIPAEYRRFHHRITRRHP